MSSRSPRSTEPARERHPDTRSTPEPVGRAFYLESLGCAKNQVDSEIMIAALEAAGWRRVDAPAEAGLLIVNTCGFISDAKKESIETCLALRRPGARLVMAGCLSERYAGELAAQLPEVDAFMGNRDPAGIAAIAEGSAPGAAETAEAAAAEAGAGAAAHAQSTPGVPRPYERVHLLSYPGSAYVKVAEGCGNRCTYCAIPLIRGGLESRAIPDVIGEIRGLLDRGARELILIAQDLGSYGKDRAGEDLEGLLREIGRLSGDFWVRLLYIHPDHFPDGVLDVMAADARFLPYFDLPFQHASPRILRAMGRRDDPDANLGLIRRIRGRLPGAVIRTTFLVGFPGETDEDFDRLLEFQAAARPDWLGAFAYSREEDTPAYAMKGRVARKTAEARKAGVERRQVDITAAALDAHVGRTLDVLIEERIEGEELSLGRCCLQAPDVDGLVVVRRGLPPGSRVPVRLDRRNGVDLEGEPVGP
jgi:ribosomal protein S12 methylthiotransferase